MICTHIITVNSSARVCVVNYSGGRQGTGRDPR